MDNILLLFLYALLASLIALSGGVLFLYSNKLSRVLEKNAIPFAAGVLVTVSLLGLIPASVESMGSNAYLYVLISFFTVFLFENVFLNLHHHTDVKKHNHLKHIKSSVPMVIVGDTIHNFIDGLAIGASFLISPGLGLITALSTFLHEVPHEIGDFGIMLKAKWAKKDILIVNIISASFTIVGAFVIYYYQASESIVGGLLAISAGIFLYLGTIDFLPHVIETKKSKMSSLVPLFLGIILMIVTLQAIPHSHSHEEDHSSDTEAHEEDNHEDEH